MASNTLRQLRHTRYRTPTSTRIRYENIFVRCPPVISGDDSALEPDIAILRSIQEFFCLVNTLPLLFWARLDSCVGDSDILDI